VSAPWGRMLLAAVLTVGCGPSSSVSVDSSVQTLVTATPQALPPFAREDARLHVAHTGVRRLEFAAVSGRGISYLERLTTDGNGNYAIEPVSVLDSSSLDWDLFSMLHQLREGFHFRYRDFRVHDPVLFLRNWRTTPLGLTTVAGRSCQRYRIERSVGERIAFELAADVETALILATEQFDADGQSLASMVYESIQLDPPVAGVAWHRPSNAERVLDEDQAAADLGFRPLQPRLLPEGYALEQMAQVTEEGGSDWLMQTFTDGIQPLFFLQALHVQDPGKLSKTGTRQEESGPETSRVVTFQVGNATVIQGRVDGFDLMLVGRAPETELLDLIESSLP